MGLALAPVPIPLSGFKQPVGESYAGQRYYGDWPNQMLRQGLQSAGEKTHYAQNPGAIIREEIRRAMKHSASAKDREIFEQWMGSTFGRGVFSNLNTALQGAEMDRAKEYYVKR